MRLQNSNSNYNSASQLDSFDTIKCFNSEVQSSKGYATFNNLRSHNFFRIHVDVHRGPVVIERLINTQPRRWENPINREEQYRAQGEAEYIRDLVDFHRVACRITHD